MKNTPIPEHHFFSEKEVLELKKRLEFLTGKKLKKINEGWRLAVAEGDDRETDALTIATNLLFNHHHDTLALREILDNYTVIPKLKNKKVEIGNTVKLTLNGTENTYTVCDPVFADISNKKISYKSPLGESLIGKKPGTYTIELAGQKTQLEILEITQV